MNATENIKKIKKSEINTEFSKILSELSNNERWTLIKICTGGLRIGVSERLVKTALADLYNKSVNEIEEIWHGLEFPYENLFQWLKNVHEYQLKMSAKVNRNNINYFLLPSLTN